METCSQDAATFCVLLYGNVTVPDEWDRSRDVRISNMPIPLSPPSDYFVRGLINAIPHSPDAPPSDYFVRGLINAIPHSPDVPPSDCFVRGLINVIPHSRCDRFSRGYIRTGYLFHCFYYMEMCWCLTNGICVLTVSLLASNTP